MITDFDDESQSEVKVARKVKISKKRKTKSHSECIEEDGEISVPTETNPCHSNPSVLETISEPKMKSSLKPVSTDRRKKKKSTLKKVKFKLDEEDGEENGTGSEITEIKQKKKKGKNKKSEAEGRKIAFKMATNTETVNESERDGDFRKQKAILYLEMWKNDKPNWKFEKLTQVWLFKNMLDESKVCYLFLTFEQGDHLSIFPPPKKSGTCPLY